MGGSPDINYENSLLRELGIKTPDLPDLPDLSLASETSVSTANETRIVRGFSLGSEIHLIGPRLEDGLADKLLAAAEESRRIQELRYADLYL